ncbi:MAG: DNA translocase FtsK [Lachnospiraceae bacterium]|nr:DNA translocase FtsK [Lachnospiraceae bacterium]
MTTRRGNKPGPKPGSKRKTTSNRGNSNRSYGGKQEVNSEIKNELILIGILAVAVFLFLCNFGIVGTFGNVVKGFMFGIFGLPAYIVPVLLFVSVAFSISNRGNYIASMKLIAGITLFLLIGVVCELFSGNLNTGESTYSIAAIYTASSNGKNGGGILCGSIAYAMVHLLDMVGTVLVIIVLGIVCVVAITEKSFLGGVKKGSKRVYETAREDVARKREIAARRQAEREEIEAREEQERLLRMDNKVSGVMLDTALSKQSDHNVVKKEDMHEIVLPEDWEEEQASQTAEDAKNMQIPVVSEVEPVREPEFDFDKIHISGIQTEQTHSIMPSEPPITIHREIKPIEEVQTEMFSDNELVEVSESSEVCQEEMESKPVMNERPVARTAKKPEKITEEDLDISRDIHKAEQKVPKKYIFPPINLLEKGKAANGNSTKLLKETAMHLQQTLNTFGVKVTITDISQGPAVTRYELQPEQGVKVSKIVGLSDDIKLNLAATDIRIEAPIPGKAAVGIEVPNKENSMVSLRDLLDTPNFKNFKSNLAFAVGKDISGQTVVSDIAKMPHMLIAGSTGSGKSVCINTIIMGILYKAHPDDVKLIMIDPKVVELSVYNGIPHLLIPVVTDPKKAAAALHWGVAEMTDRYKKFADYNVRDLKGYNKMVENMQQNGEADVPAKMSQILIIVDELADLMMVAPGEVEESICRLAQLARAAGIHLIIATQRPSVDVITGLIKANMPSRVAFAVSSGVDSRTILDMNGAEKLLGKGDMLFYPQGYPKPARVQGAFVSDKEVSDVVDFLKNQAIGNVYSEDIAEKIATMGTTSSAAGGSAEERDAYFVEAGKFIIEKEKASIGMLQRVFKIGFNRAARIMDQLAEAGVVGEEEGTKPRKVLMSEEQFESFIEESV